MTQRFAYKADLPLHPVPPAARWRVQPGAIPVAVKWVEWAALSLCLLIGFWGLGARDWGFWTGLGWLGYAGGCVWLYWAIARPKARTLSGGLEAGGAAKAALRAWAVVLPLALAVVFAFAGAQAAGMMVVPLMGAVALNWALRRLVARHMPDLIRAGRVGLRVVIAGGGAEASELLDRLVQMRAQGVHVLGLFDDREVARSPMVQNGVAKLGNMSHLPDFIRRAEVDLIILTMPPSAEARIAQILSNLWELPVDIRLSPVKTALMYRPRAYSWFGDVPLLDLFDRPLRARDAVIKRMFDLALGSLLLVVFAPLIGLIALAVALDTPGPVFFRQWREGYNGQGFRVWKFRTLFQDCADSAGAVSVKEGDDRVTAMGRVLRRSSLDELPQLFNVIRGEMSLVGPRPHAVDARNRDLEFSRAVRHYGARHRVKPGMTGWAQINGLRGPVTTVKHIQDRVAYDLDYIDRWSPLLDLRILMMTLPAILSGENAV